VLVVPDEDVAAELEQTAARSGYAAAAAAYERAVQLTVDPAARARRLTLAAEAAAEIGDFDRARDLAIRAMGQAADPAAYARMASVGALATLPRVGSGPATGSWWGAAKVSPKPASAPRKAPGAHRPACNAGRREGTRDTRPGTPARREHLLPRPGDAAAATAMD